MKNRRMFAIALTASILLLCSAALAAPSGKPIALPFELGQPSLIMESMPADAGRSLDAPGDIVDFDAALIAGGNYLKRFQADVTDDNAGNGWNGTNENPNDPDDGGWDWRLNWNTDPWFHSVNASPTNIYGATAQGLYYAYLATSNAGYWTALLDAATKMVANANIRSGADLRFLMLFDALYDSVVSPTSTYADAAKAKYDGRITTYGSAGALARYIRDARHGQGYDNGIIAWDIGIWAVDAQMLYDRYGGTYAADADSIAEVLWQDSFNDSPGYFDIDEDDGWDPTYTDKNYWWYTIGLTGLIDAFYASGAHTGEIAGLITRLQASQHSNGAFSDSYGVHDGDEDWQDTAYILMTLQNYNATTYATEIHHGAYWLGATQHTGGGWVYDSGNHYPEVGGECTAALSFGSAPSEVWVDDNWHNQADVDAGHPGLVWGYDAFGTIQNGINAVAGSTVNVAAGTYSVTSTILANKNDLRLLGPKANVDPRPSASTTRVPGSPSEAILDGGSSLGIIIRISAQNVEINGLEVRNGTGDLIESQNVAPVKQSPAVRYCIIHDAGDEGVQLRNVDDGVLEYNRVYNTVGDGLNFAYSNDCIIQYNECHDIYSENAAIYCYNDGGRGYIGVTIQNNLLYNLANNDGIKLGAKSPGNDRNLRGGRILNNIVHSGVQDGITLYASDSRVEGNEVYNCNSENGAIYVSYPVSFDTISNNQVYNNGITGDSKTTVGIRIGGGSYSPSNIRVVGNSLRNNEQTAYDNAVGNYWDSNCYSDFSSNPGYPDEYRITNGTIVTATDVNPNTNDCGNVDFIVTSDYLGCELACRGDTLYLTFDQAGYNAGQIFVQLPAALDADWAPGTGDVVVMPSTNVSPNLYFSHASRTPSGNQIEVNVAWSPPYSDGDGTKYIACIPIKNVSATGGETLVITGAGSTFYDASGPHVNEFTLGSTTIYVDCADPVATIVYVPALTCDGFGAASQMEGKITIGVLRGAVPPNSPLKSGYVEVNANAVQRITLFSSILPGDFGPATFPSSAEATQIWGWLNEGCNNLVVHAFDTECNEGISAELVVVRDETPPNLTIVNHPRCYSPNTYTLLDDSLDVTTVLNPTAKPAGCFAQTGTVEITYLGGTAFSLALDVTNYPSSDAEALVLWTWILTQVPGNANGGNYIFDVKATDCAGNTSATKQFTLCIDLTAPGNTFTIFDARPTHLGVWLKWQWTYDAAQAVAVEIYRAPEGDYPLYASQLWNGDANYAKDHSSLSGWTLVASQAGPQNTSGAYPGTYGGPGNTYWLDQDALWQNASGVTYRDIYRYVTFVKDNGGNWSLVGTYSIGTNADRSTNYWLGDYTADVTNPAPYGWVGGADLDLLSVVYFTTTANGGGTTANYFSIGPENHENGYGKGIPTPDNYVNFLDLIPFSFNFGVVTPTGFNIHFPDTKPFSGLDEQPVVSVSRGEDVQLSVGDNFTVTVALSGNAGHSVKVVEAELHFDPQVLKFVSATEGAIEVMDGIPFALTRSIEGRENAVGIAAAAMGEIACIAGDFALATIEFQWIGEQTSTTEIELTSIQLADGHGNIIEGTGTTLTINGADAVPLEFALYQNYPNPFNPSTQIRFDLADASEVRLVVFNLLGQKVRTLVAANMPAGAHHIAWDGRDDRGLDVSTGLYLYKLQAASFVSCRKMLLTR